MEELDNGSKSMKTVSASLSTLEEIKRVHVEREGFLKDNFNHLIKSIISNAEMLDFHEHLFHLRTEIQGYFRSIKKTYDSLLNEHYLVFNKDFKMFREKLNQDICPYVIPDIQEAQLISLMEKWTSRSGDLINVVFEMPVVNPAKFDKFSVMSFPIDEKIAVRSMATIVGSIESKNMFPSEVSLKKKILHCLSLKRL